MRNKTDKADARGIAHIMRTGWLWEVHVKSDKSYRLRLLLTQRRNLKHKFLDIENAIRHSIKTFALRLGRVGHDEFETRVCELVADDPRPSPPSPTSCCAHVRRCGRSTCGCTRW